MKKHAILLLSLSVFLFTSCEKFEKPSEEKEYYLECGMQFDDYCSDTNFEDPTIVEEGLSVYIFEPLVVSDDCNCIVSGAVKYVKNNKTVALVYYGDGDCDHIAKKIICVNGDCKDKNASVCFFDPNCASPDNN